ncbi:MAG: sulfotransferase [Gammaproteobacteria bacterium]
MRIPVKAAVLHGINAILSPLEALMNRGARESILGRHPPVFIVGPPRSGSTLLYQMMVDAFDVAYLSNLHCAFYRVPSIVERMIGTRVRRNKIRFVSDFGKTRGYHGPSECGRFWYRYLPRFPHALTPELVSAAAIGSIREAIAGLTSASGKSVVFKNLVISVRIPVIAQSLPEAIFVRVDRDFSEIKRSILRARDQIQGAESWFSVRPSNYTELAKLSTRDEQVTGQVASIYDEIARAFTELPVDRTAIVRYTSLRDTPAPELARLRERLSQLGAEV